VKATQPPGPTGPLLATSKPNSWWAKPQPTISHLCCRLPASGLRPYLGARRLMPCITAGLMVSWLGWAGLAGAADGGEPIKGPNAEWQLANKAIAWHWRLAEGKPSTGRRKFDDVFGGPFWRRLRCSHLIPTGRDGYARCSRLVCAKIPRRLRHRICVTQYLVTQPLKSTSSEHRLTVVRRGSGAGTGVPASGPPARPTPPAARGRAAPPQPHASAGFGSTSFCG